MMLVVCVDSIAKDRGYGNIKKPPTAETDGGRRKHRKPFNFARHGFVSESHYTMFVSDWLYIAQARPSCFNWRLQHYRAVNDVPSSQDQLWVIVSESSKSRSHCKLLSYKVFQPCWGLCVSAQTPRSLIMKPPRPHGTGYQQDASVLNK